MAQTEQDGERSLGQLVASASRDISALMRAEIALAKAEAREEVKTAATGGALFGMAGFLGLLAVILLTIAAAYGLVAAGLHPAWAFLIVAGAFLLLAGLLALIGRGRMKKVGPPQRTIRTVKDSLATVRHRHAVEDQATPAIEPTGSGRGALPSG
ncbi:MAG: phage holin family protein [Actinomycetes bacterium]